MSGKIIRKSTGTNKFIDAQTQLLSEKKAVRDGDIKTTLRYAHLAPAHKRNAVNVLDSLLTPSTNFTPPENCTITAQETEKESANVS